MIERQDDKLKIALTDATTLGLKGDWYVGEGGVNTAGVQTISLTSPGRPLFGDRGGAGDTVNVTVTLSDAFRGTVQTPGQSFDVERKELTTDGLTARLDADAPETGWYATGDGKTSSFFESQGGKAFVISLSTVGDISSMSSIEAEKAGKSKWTAGASSVVSQTTDEGVLRFALSASGATSTLERTQFAKRTGAFVEDLGKSTQGRDADGDGVRDDINIVISDGVIRSSRVRDALTEIARAYGSYLASPSAATATDAIQRVELASDCLRILAASVPDTTTSSLVESLLFNTAARFKAEQNISRLIGPRLIEQSSVSLANPNACATFMQGVTRRYDTLSQSTIRRAQARSSEATSERAMSSARRRTPSPMAVTPVNSCAGTRILLVTGIVTGNDGANKSKNYIEDIIRNSSIDSTDFRYSAFADQNPGVVNDIFQFLVGSVGTTAREAADLIRTGFRIVYVGRLVQKLVKTPKGYAAGELIIRSGQATKLIGLYALLAVAENAADEAALASLMAQDVDNDLRVIAVAHSRGNLRSNSAYGKLSSDQRSAVAIASVANAAKNVASGGTGATRDDDLIIAATRKLFGSEAATFPNAGKPRDFFTRHFLDKSYLDNPTARGKVISRIKDALSRADVPPGSSDRILTQSSGGFTGPSGQNDTVQIGKNGVTFKVNYEAYSIPDQFRVLYRGRQVAGTPGLVSGSGTLNVRLPADPDNPTDGEVIIAVYGPDPGTAWDYEVVCPSTSSQSAAAMQTESVQ